MTAMLGSEASYEIDRVHKDRLIEATLADNLAATGHHSKECHEIIASTLDLDKCECGWSKALLAWRIRRDG